MPAVVAPPSVCPLRWFDLVCLALRVMALTDCSCRGRVDEHLEDTFNNTFRALRVVDPAAPAGQRNLKLAEFTSPPNWNYENPADEFELFDLDADRWETKNLYKTADPALKARLHASLEKLYRCKGASCT
eukprot:SAG31_NODE_2393_length_5793_cov_18.326484_9_plen_130_part_00